MNQINYQPIVEAIGGGARTVPQIVEAMTKLGVKNADRFVRDGIVRLMRREQIARTRGGDGHFHYQRVDPASEA